MSVTRPLVGPKLGERPVLAVDGILRGLADRGDVPVRLVDIDFVRPNLIEGTAGRRIGADDQEVGARGDAAVSGAGGQDHDVARLDVERLALVAAELDR